MAILSELLEGEENVLAIGDLKYRIGCDGNNLSPEEITNDLFTHRRASLDSTINPRGHVLTQYLADGGLVVLNGRSPSDPVGNYTFVRSADSKSVIDLAFCSFPLLPFLTDFKIPISYSTSDLLPIMVTLN